VRVGADQLHLCDLDEALFSLPGLLDFTATVNGPEDKRRLRIHAAVLDAPFSPDANAVARAVSGIGVIARAAGVGCLAVEAETEKAADWVQMHAGKRTIFHEEGACR